MNIESELLSSRLERIIKENIRSFDGYLDEIVDSAAICALDEIKSVISEGQSDPDIVEQIVEVLKKYNIDTGACHNPFYLLDKAARENGKRTASERKLKAR